MAQDSIVRIADVSKTYKLEKLDVPVLFDVDLEVGKGEFVAIMGPSGCGKSTLMNLIGCLDRPTGGKIFIKGTDVSQLNDSGAAEIRNKHIGFVFQTFNLLPRISAEENVEVPLIYGGVPRNERHRLSHEALKAVGIADRVHHKPNEMSGGERQRVAIARAIINKPSIILADEPTGNLDSKSGHEVMKIFDSLNKSGVTILMVTHDPNIAGWARRTVRLFDGRVTEDKVTK